MDKFKTIGSLLLSVASLIPGIYFFILVLRAYKTGTIIPAALKHGELTGIQAMIVGTLMLAISVGSLAFEVRRMLKRSNANGIHH